MPLADVAESGIIGVAHIVREEIPRGLMLAYIAAAACLVVRNHQEILYGYARPFSPSDEDSPGLERE